MHRQGYATMQQYNNIFFLKLQQIMIIDVQFSKANYEVDCKYCWIIIYWDSKDDFTYC